MDEHGRFWDKQVAHYLKFTDDLSTPPPPLAFRTTADLVPARDKLLARATQMQHPAVRCTQSSCASWLAWTMTRTRNRSWWAGRESNPHSFRGGFTDRWARHVPFADPMRHTLRQGGEGLQFSQPHNSLRGQRLRALRPAPPGRHQPPQLPRPLCRPRPRPADPG